MNEEMLTLRLDGLRKAGHRGYVFLNTSSDNAPWRFASRCSKDRLRSSMRTWTGRELESSDLLRAYACDQAAWNYQDGTAALQLYGIPPLPAFRELSSMCHDKSHEFMHDVLQRASGFTLVIDCCDETIESAAQVQAKQAWAKRADWREGELKTELTVCVDKFVRVRRLASDNWEIEGVPCFS